MANTGAANRAGKGSGEEFSAFGQRLQDSAQKAGARAVVKKAEALRLTAQNLVETEPGYRGVTVEQMPFGIILSGRGLFRRLFARPSLRWLGGFIR